ncbi:MAG TPA: energy-dependent translational throttle protein EttA [Planctomycetaceae bacterium]|nr:energy-dependent translational throttle protein EttA [Planctomycetaceae bacterium]
MSLISLVNAEKDFGIRTLFADLTLHVGNNDRLGLIGPNGAGKSTLLRVLAGQEPLGGGERRCSPRLRVELVGQESQVQPGLTVLEQVLAGCGEKRDLLLRFSALTEAVASEPDNATLLGELGHLSQRMDEAEAWGLEQQCQEVLQRLGISDLHKPVESLSGGYRKRVGLASALVACPDVLLLDEPTNHLDAEVTDWLESYLLDADVPLILVTHDRYFLDNVAGWILELDRGKGIPYEGNYSSWLEQKQKRLEQEERAESRRQKELKQELEWVRMSPKARSTKNKARLQRYQELAAKDYDARDGAAQIQIPISRPLGQKVVIAENLTKSFDGRTIFKDMSFNLPPGGIVGVIGPNGAGKTTLFRIMMGQEQPDSGNLIVGDSVEFSYVDQSRDELEAGKTVYEEISGGADTLEVGRSKIHARAYCGRFNFRGKDQQKFVGDLSGGERNRVHMAKLLRSGGNLLLLDEPTNDLDVDTLRALEEGLSTFGGCAVVVSHDRWFLDRIATHILAFEGDGSVTWCEGNYEMYERERKERLGDSADQPAGGRFKPLTR